MNKGNKILLSLGATLALNITLYADSTVAHSKTALKGASQEPVTESPLKNLTLYGTGAKDKFGNSNGIGIRYEDKKYLLSAEISEDIKRVSGTYIFALQDSFYLKSALGYLEKDFQYRGESLRAKQLQIGMALLYTDSKKFAIELGQVESVLNNLGHADTTSHLTFLNGIYKNGRFEIAATAQNANVYGKNYTNILAGTGYFPTDNIRVGINYSSLSHKKGDSRVGLGFSYSFGDPNQQGKFSPYFSGSYSSSSHTRVTFNYEKDIANESLHLRDTLREYIESTEITAQSNPKEFNKRLDQNIEDKNQAPVAKDDIATVEEGGVYIIDVLANDYDTEGRKLKNLEILQSNGNFSVLGNKIKFDAKTLPGEYTCEYIISDGDKTGKAKLTVTVTKKLKPIPKPTPTPDEVNEPPVAVGDSVTTHYQTPVIIDVLKNDTDPNQDNLTILNLANFVGGTAKIKDNKVYFTPNKGFSGTASFTYYAYDGEKRSIKPATVTITVEKEKVINNPPIINSINGNFNSIKGESNFLSATVSDEDISSLTYEWKVNGKIYSSKTFNTSVLPVGNYTGTLTIIDNKGQKSKAKTFSGEIKEKVNHAPVIHQTSFDGGFAKSATFPGVVSDDGPLSNITITASPTEGTLVYNGDGSITYTRTDGNTGGSDVFSVTFSDGSRETTTTMTFTGFDDI